jgi:aryl-alcohol dehydrogenase-like predicted oxidoreductase
MDPTQRVPLGRTHLAVTRLGLGTAALGGMFEPVSDVRADATVTRAHELGWRFIDTAPLYGHGLAETRTGATLAKLPRDDIVVSTKVGRVLEPSNGDEKDSIFKEVPPFVPRFDFSAEGVFRSHADSMERMQLNHVDVVHIHDPDDHYEDAIAHAFPALALMRDKGAIGAVGAGMNQTEMLCRFASDADFDCFLVAGRYTLLDTSASIDLLPLCAAREIAVICGGVFNSGVLASGDTYDYASAPAEVRDRVRQLERVCGRHDVPLKAAAIQFPLGHPAVTCVVVGARSPNEVEENDAMFRFDIPGALWSDLQSEGLLPAHVPTP